MFTGSSGYHVIGGQICLVDNNFWRVNRLSKLSDMQRRKSFRVRVNARGKAYSQSELSALESENEEPEGVPIKVLDISLSGILFETSASFNLNDLIYIYDIQLTYKAPVFSALCLVRRLTRSGSKVRYGCSFENLSEWEEDSLFSTILGLHRNEIRRRRKQS